MESRKRISLESRATRKLTCSPQTFVPASGTLFHYEQEFDIRARRIDCRAAAKTLNHTLLPGAVWRYCRISETRIRADT
jgi:hypothetical protein